LLLLLVTARCERADTRHFCCLTCSRVQRDPHGSNLQRRCSGLQQGAHTRLAKRAINGARFSDYQIGKIAQSRSRMCARARLRVNVSHEYMFQTFLVPITFIFVFSLMIKFRTRHHKKSVSAATLNTDSRRRYAIDTVYLKISKLNCASSHHIDLSRYPQQRHVRATGQPMIIFTAKYGKDCHMNVQRHECTCFRP
jgi:hypothetical protein